MFTRINRPSTTLTVVVTDSRYDMFGDIRTIRSAIKTKTLANLLKSLGGINESVEAGVYDFWTTRKGLKLVAHLEPQNK